MLRWGLIPSWADDPKIGYSTINARAETVATKPAFREAFRKRRCLVPMDGFYEWQAVAGGKQRYRITMKDGEHATVPSSASPGSILGWCSGNHGGKSARWRVQDAHLRRRPSREIAPGAELRMGGPNRRLEGSVISINIILAIIGFVVGAAIGLAAFALVIDGGRRETYQLMAIRHPWIRLLSMLWIVACGAVVAIVAYWLAG